MSFTSNGLEMKNGGKMLGNSFLQLCMIELWKIVIIVIVAVVNSKSNSTTRDKFKIH